MITTKAGTLPNLRIVVLAAGFSSRLGRPKALTPIHGLTLLRRTVGLLAPLAAGSPIIVVIPPRAARYRIGSSRHCVAFVSNARRAAGMSSSVRAGLRRAGPCAAVMLLPVDLVNLESADIAKLIARWRGARRRVVARRVAAGAAAPLILPRWLFALARNLQGEEGLRDMVRRLPRNQVVLENLPSAERDLDTAQDLLHARRRFRPGRCRSPRL